MPSYLLWQLPSLVFAWHFLTLCPRATRNDSSTLLFNQTSALLLAFAIFVPVLSLALTHYHHLVARHASVSIFNYIFMNSSGDGKQTEKKKSVFKTIRIRVNVAADICETYVRWNP